MAFVPDYAPYPTAPYYPPFPEFETPPQMQVIRAQKIKKPKPPPKPKPPKVIKPKTIEEPVVGTWTVVARSKNKDIESRANQYLAAHYKGVNTCDPKTLLQDATRFLGGMSGHTDSHKPRFEGKYPIKTRFAAPERAKLIIPQRYEEVSKPAPPHNPALPPQPYGYPYDPYMQSYPAPYDPYSVAAPTMAGYPSYNPPYPQPTYAPTAAAPTMTAYAPSISAYPQPNPYSSFGTGGPMYGGTTYTPY